MRFFRIFLFNLFKQLSDGSKTEKTFKIANEDHTLGNALKYILNKKFVCFLIVVIEILL